MKAMLSNPIEQPDAPGTFSMNEEAIKEVNPNYGKTITEANSQSLQDPLRLVSPLRIVKLEK